jgi:hypothetical protein
MLRYKNSLLERILLEKGIDVAAELQRKTGSPALGPTAAPPLSMAQGSPAPLQRAMINRHNQQVRRSLSSLPKVEPAPSVQGSHDGIFHGSPMLQPTPSSHISSPSSASPAFGPQGSVITPPGTDMQSIQMSMQAPSMPATSPQSIQFVTSGANIGHVAGTVGPASTAGSSSSYYTSPFQNHMDQLGLS